MSDTTRTKQLIKNVLIDLCQTQSFRKISVQKIANEAKINRQTFYYHFTDKYDLLRWVYCEDALHYLDPQCLTLDNWEEQALKMLKAIAEKKEFYANTVLSDQEILQKEFSQLIQNLLSRFLSKWMKKDSFLQKINYFMLVFFLRLQRRVSQLDHE